MTVPNPTLAKLVLSQPVETFLTLVPWPVTRRSPAATLVTVQTRLFRFGTKNEPTIALEATWKPIGAPVGNMTPPMAVTFRLGQTNTYP